MTFQIGDKVIFKTENINKNDIPHNMKKYAVFHGTIAEIEANADYPIKVNFGHNTRYNYQDGYFEWFSREGKFVTNDSKPSLFLDTSDVEEMVEQFVDVRRDVTNTDAEELNLSNVDRLIEILLGSEKYNGHHQSQLGIDAKTNLSMIVDLCRILEEYLHRTKGFRGSVYVQMFTDYSWSIYAEDKLLVSSLD